LGDIFALTQNFLQTALLQGTKLIVTPRQPLLGLLAEETLIL